MRLKRLLVLGALLLATPPFPAFAGDNGTRTITVYGRDRCGYTQATLAALRAAGVPFRYLHRDDPATRRALFAKMDTAGIPDGPFKLPVVEVDGQLSVRPDVAHLVDRARSGPR
jgi:glutaredoxin